MDSVQFHSLEHQRRSNHILKMPADKRRGEAGQAVLSLILGLTFFLFAAVGIGIDGSHLYAQRQMAQAAADAAAQAGVMSLYDGTNKTGATHYFSTTTGVHNCGASDAATPCYYAQTLNGFNVSATSDAVAYEPNPSGLSIPNLSTTAPVNLLRVTVSRSVPTFLIRLLGPTATTVSASGAAAIVNTISPVPLVITHPTMAGALNMNGTTNITICGGPQQSIQVNSDGSNPAGAAFSGPSSGNVDLSKAGTADVSGDCSAGTGADFGTFGGPSAQPSSILLGSTGNYYGKYSPIPDPLANVAAPSTTGLTNRTGPVTCTHCSACPAPQFTGTAPATCSEYLPGIYSSLNVSGVSSAIFDPGVYYIQGGGFSIKNSTVQMCSSCAADANTVNGMVIYDTGSTSHPTATGGFVIDTNAYAVLWGGGVSSGSLTSAPSSPYYGILFFEDRAADAQTHNLGAGNGCFSVVGTVYITNTLSMMQNDAAHYQSVIYHGTPCSSTQNVGEIIVSQLTVKGTSGINMRLLPTGYLKLNKVALVN